MRKLYAFMLVLVSIAISILFAQNLHAASADIVISQIKVGNSSNSRLIEIFNNSSLPIDITGWCLKYSSPNNTAPFTSLGCFSNPEPAVHIFIGARSFALFASTQTGLLFDVELLPGLGSGTSGHVYLYDNVDSEIDRVGWGEAINAESNRPVILSTTKVIERKKDPTSGLLIDTDNNENDFFNSTMRSQYKVGSIYEILDMCKNISDIQLEVPSGYTVGGNGDCIPPPADVCTNLDGLQLTLPPGYEFDSNSNCQFDNCLNIDGLQVVMPDGYKLGADNYCVLSLHILQITELLPNATGSDDGNEYIEIYNPSDDEADLSKYILSIGSDGERFSFPNGSIIRAKQYMTFSNDDIKFNLVNTTGSVSLYSIDNQLISETEIYNDPNDGMSWALIGSLWQYTNQPTPGSLNIISLSKTDGEILTTSSLQPCAANQYRSVETGRCRLIVSSSSILSPCKDGQYRSEETNRCRNIAADVSGLSPCGEGQERNPETNRCRLVSAVLGSSNLAPCKEGQERNPETNRCRNIAGTMPKADYAPQKTSEQSNNAILWWSLAAVGLVAVGYGAWEWRQEVVEYAKKFKMLITRKTV